jgi:cyclophilin family peptidyl-prolyl cis-trans isomerase
MSKSKRRADSRRAADGIPSPDAEEVELPEAWKKRPWVPYLIMAIVVALVLGAGLALQQAVTQPRAQALANCKTSTAVGAHVFIAAQPICIVPNHKYTATLNTTQGKIVIELLPDTAPVTVNNFIVLALNGYYNGSPFWDSQDWVVQTGDPNGNGTGGPGYTLPEEPASFLKWNAGSVGMARIPGGPVNGSQFFIQKGAWPGAGPTATYNRFGTVVGGLDKLRAITSTDKINSITIAVT